MWMRGYQISPRLNSYMPRHLFLYATTCSNTCRFWLVFYEPLCWEASRTDVLLTAAVRGLRCRLCLLVMDEKATHQCWAISEDEIDFDTNNTNLSVDVKFDMLSHRVTFKVTSQIVRSLVTCRSSLDHRVSYLRTQHLPPDASCKPRFTFLARSPRHLLL